MANGFFPIHHDGRTARRGLADEKRINRGSKANERPMSRIGRRMAAADEDVKTYDDKSR
jgi:hypothetical protein